MNDSEKTFILIFLFTLGLSTVLILLPRTDWFFKPFIIALLFAIVNLLSSLFIFLIFDFAFRENLSYLVGGLALFGFMSVPFTSIAVGILSLILLPLLNKR
jgi:hypothetical protein